MPAQACMDNIKRSDPPVYCNDIDTGYCDKIQAKINKYCQHNGLGGDTPVPQISRDGRDCWCCCSCFAYNTPIEVTPGQYKFIQDIQMNETVLTTGPDVTSWVAREVTELGGMAEDTMMDFMYYLTARMAGPAGDDVRYLITTADHLYLLPDGTLKPVQDLHPGDQIRQADGGIATVVFAVPGQYTGGVRHIATGAYSPGEPLDGHLLNSNGLVTADLAVQLAHYGGLLHSAVLHADNADSKPALGSAAFLAAYPPTRHPELHAFLFDKKAWPKGFEPRSTSLINIPPSAVSFFTEGQAVEIQAKIRQLSPGNSAVIATVDYLFRIYKAFNPDVLFIIDWNNELPNAYFFKDLRYPMVVLNGGLARLEPLTRDGLAVIMSHMMAAAAGSKCVGPADYNGVMIYLRQAWNNEFFSVFRNGLAQLEQVFAALEPDTAEGDPDDICGQPSVACRVATLQAGAAMDDLPSCAIPHAAFRIASVTADARQESVVVAFTELLNLPTAETAGNYVVDPNDKATAPVRVKSAVVGEDFKAVTLTVTGLEPAAAYTLTVKEVLDEHDHPLAADGRVARFLGQEVGHV